MAKGHQRDTNMSKECVFYQRAREQIKGHEKQQKYKDKDEMNRERAHYEDEEGRRKSEKDRVDDRSLVTFITGLFIC